MRIAYPIALSLFTAGGLAAQTDNRDVMVVFDMSGSMWGQVDGVAKVEIARDAFDGLLGKWSDTDTRTGLIAYGHRERGNCADIELLATPGDGADIAGLVAGLQPRGKTPLSDAVRQAAEVLRFTEEAATVVLLSDGVENCSADPCSVGAELEALGLDFTAHVIGFDIAEGDRAQLQCLADATGGQYFDASDAGELAEAMDGVIQATAESVVETPTHQDLTVRVAFDRSLRLPDSFTIYSNDVELGTLTEDTAIVPGLLVNLPLGPLTLRVEGDGITGELITNVAADTEFLVIDASGVQADYVIWRDGTFPILAAGDSPLDNQQYILINNTTGVDRASFHETYLVPSGSSDMSTAIKGGRLAPDADQFNLTTITSPTTPGDYDFVMLASDGTEFGRIPVRFASTIAPEWHGPREVLPGEVLDALWDGPSQRSDGFQLLAADSNRTASFTRRTGVENMATPDGFKLTAPDEPGLYRLMFITNVINMREFDAVDMGLIAVGVPLPDAATDEEFAPVDESRENSMAIEADAMGGEEGELIPVGDLHGNWKMILQNPQGMGELMNLSLIQEQGDPMAEGDYVVTAAETVGLGATGTADRVTLTQTSDDAMTLTLTTGQDVVIVSLTRGNVGWRGALDAGRDGTVYDIVLVKEEDLAAADAAEAVIDVATYAITAVDERGNIVAGPVTWIMADTAAQIAVRPDTRENVLYETDRAAGTYLVTAIAGDLIGSHTVTLRPNQQNGNTVVLRPSDERSDLDFFPEFYCSEGEDCDMALDIVPVSFTLPVGWGAERPIRGRDGQPMFNMTTNTADGPFYATLNQPQRSADLGPCYDVLLGIFCHDATDDSQRLAEVDIIRSSLSFKSAGGPRSEDDMNSLLNQLTGGSN